MPAHKPNVLFVVVDDLRPQLGCYGQDWILSPNIDRLAQDGLLFERAYCQQAICAPSRASVLSGCRPDTTTIYGLRTPLRTAMPDVISLPQHFRKNGYETVSVGKVYHHAKDDLQGWSTEPFQSKGDWKGRGYLTDEAIEAIIRCDREQEAMGSSRRGLGPAYEAADVADEGYHDGKDALAAIRELQRLATLERPFFLGLGFHKPHLPFAAPKRYWNMYDPAAIPLAANPFAPEGVTEFSLTDFGELRGYFGMPKEGRIPDDLARNLIHGYAACVTYMDAQLGKVLDELQALGLAENTVILLWGDHGWKLGEHDSWSKHTNFEIDARAPMLVSTPQTRGTAQRTSALVEFVDMYPSLCELCGLPVPDHCEGTSFAPLIGDPEQPWKRAAFSQYPRRNGEVMGYTMRTARYRYTEWQDRASGEVLARELYDHQSDPQENVNQVAYPEAAALVDELSAMLAQGWLGTRQAFEAERGTARSGAPLSGLQAIGVRYQGDQYVSDPHRALEAYLAHQVYDRAGVPVDYAEPRLPEDNRETDPVLRLGDLGNEIASLVADARQRGDVVAMTGGNCSHVTGVLGGLQEAHGPATRIGLVWFDAHGDFNTEKTTLSGSLGGMPVAVCAGLTLPEWRERSHILSPLPTDRIVMTDLRNLDPLEKQLIEATEATVVPLSDLEQAAADLASRVDMIYLHIDADILDAALVPSHRTQEPDGPDMAQVLAAIEGVMATGKVVAYAVVSVYYGGADAEVDLASGIELVGEGLATWKKYGTVTSL